MNENDGKEMPVKLRCGKGPSLLLVVAVHAPSLEPGFVVGALFRGEDRLALSALGIRVSRQSAAFVDIRQAKRQRHIAILAVIQALAFAILKVVINNRPDTEIAVVATLGAVKPEVCDMDVAGDEEGVGASNESGSGGDD